MYFQHTRRHINHGDQLATEATDTPRLHNSCVLVFRLHTPKTHRLMMSGLFNQKNIKISHRSKRRAQGLQGGPQIVDIGTRFERVKGRGHGGFFDKRTKTNELKVSQHSVD